VANREGKVLLANSSADTLFKARRKTVAQARGRPVDPPLEGREIQGLLAKFSREDAGSWADTWRDSHAHAKNVSIEARLEEARDFLIRIAPLFSTDGTQSGSIVALIETTALRESERRRDEALRFLSHDMRSPQASILTLLSMYNEDPDCMPLDKLTGRIEKYSRRTLNLADEFLQLAKAERARAEDFEVMDLDEIVRDAIDEAWSMAATKRIRLECRAIDDAWIRGDRDMLTRVLINLFSNAVKYSPEDTEIEVLLDRTDDGLVLAVADQGYGISKDDMSRLFTRYARMKHEDQPEEEGVGLGLVFVKTVVERHKGEIAVTSMIASENEGRHGTTFTLRFPLAEPPAEAADQAD
jgi:signal transduction histidine kinase